MIPLHSVKAESLRADPVIRQSDRRDASLWARPIVGAGQGVGSSVAEHHRADEETRLGPEHEGEQRSDLFRLSVTADGQGEGIHWGPNHRVRAALGKHGCLGLARCDGVQVDARANPLWGWRVSPHPMGQRSFRRRIGTDGPHLFPDVACDFFVAREASFDQGRRYRTRGIVVVEFELRRTTAGSDARARVSRNPVTRSIVPK